MGQNFARGCDRAFFVCATALEPGFRFATDAGGRSLWFYWPAHLSLAVLDQIREPLIITLVQDGDHSSAEINRPLAHWSAVVLSSRNGAKRKSPRSAERGPR